MSKVTLPIEKSRLSLTVEHALGLVLLLEVDELRPLGPALLALRLVGHAAVQLVAHQQHAALRAPLQDHLERKRGGGVAKLREKSWHVRMGD